MSLLHDMVKVGKDGGDGLFGGVLGKHETRVSGTFREFVKHTETPVCVCV